MVEISALNNLGYPGITKEPRIESMLIMSAKERDRLMILMKVCEAHLTVADDAEHLSISQRQTHRIL